MAVDMTYGEGPIERGYGLPVKLINNHMLTFEIAPWQTLDLWRYDFAIKEWT